jgi:hypothetical protein
VGHAPGTAASSPKGAKCYVARPMPAAKQRVACGTTRAYVATYGSLRSPAVAEITGPGREWTVWMISELSLADRSR